MTKTEIAKKIATTIVSIGASKITGDIIKNNAHIDNNLDRVTVASAGAVIGYAVGDSTSKYTDKKIDEAIDWWKTNITK